MEPLFNFLLKMREASLVRWAMKFLKIQEAPPLVRYRFMGMLFVFKFFLAFLGFLVMVKPWEFF